MCTIIFAHGVSEGFAVASNRDEEYGRDFSPPSLVETDEGWYVAPQDDREGGTWLGYNDAGVVVTLSNLPVSPSDVPEDELRSRGKLVVDLLRARSVEVALEELRASFEHHEYAGCNIVVGSSRDCFVGVNEADGEGARLVRPSEGVGVVTNSPFDDPSGKALSVAEAAPSPSDHDDAHDWLDATRPLLASHEDPTVCVHDESNDRGTTSSSLLYVPEYPRRASFRFADAPPCATEYVECTPPKEF